MSIAELGFVGGLFCVLTGALILVELLVRRMDRVTRRLTGWILVGLMGGGLWLLILLWVCEWLFG